MEVQVNTDKLKFHKIYRLTASRDKLFFSFSLSIPTRHPPTSKHGTFEHHQRNIIHHHYHRVWAKSSLRKETLVMFPPYKLIVSRWDIQWCVACLGQLDLEVPISQQVKCSLSLRLGLVTDTWRWFYQGNPPTLPLQLVVESLVTGHVGSPPHWLNIWL